MNKDVVPLNKPEELINWLKEHDKDLSLSEEEAKLLLGYFEGHDYLMGVSGDKMYRIDLQDIEGGEELVDYPIEDVVDIVCEWNYEQLEEARAVVDHPKDFAEYCEYKFTYDALKEDETALNQMFAQTIYGRDVRNVARAMIGQAGGQMPEALAVHEDMKYQDAAHREEGRKR